MCLAKRSVTRYLALPYSPNTIVFRVLDFISPLITIFAVHSVSLLSSVPLKRLDGPPEPPSPTPRPTTLHKDMPTATARRPQPRIRTTREPLQDLLHNCAIFTARLRSLARLCLFSHGGVWIIGFGLAPAISSMMLLLHHGLWISSCHTIRGVGACITGFGFDPAFSGSVPLEGVPSRGLRQRLRP